MSAFRNRWLRWSLLGAALIGLGVGIYQVQPPAPMCEIGGASMPICIVDGRLWTAVEAWNVRTGQRVAGPFVPDTDLVGSPVLSLDKSLMATEANSDEGRRLCLFELRRGGLHEWPVEHRYPRLLYFSPKGKYLVCINGEQPNVVLDIYDTVTFKQTVHRETLGLLGGGVFTDDFILHRIGDSQTIEVLDPSVGRSIRILDRMDGHITVSDNGRHIFSDRLDLAANRWTTEVWNVAQGKVEATFTDSFHHARLFSSDYRYMAAARGAGPIETVLRDFPACQLQGSPITAGCAAFSPDHRYLAVRESVDHVESLALVAVPLGAIRCKIPWTEPLVKGLFSHDSRKVFSFESDTAALGCYECETGRLHRAIPFANAVGITATKMTPDHRHLLVQRDHGPRPLPNWLARFPFIVKFLEKQKLDHIVVVDTDTGDVECELIGFDALSCMISDDGTTLVTAHQNEMEESRTLRCWDVNGIKPLRWAIGVPASLGAICISYTWRRRRRTTTSA